MEIAIEYRRNSVRPTAKIAYCLRSATEGKSSACSDCDRWGTACGSPYRQIDDPGKINRELPCPYPGYGWVDRNPAPGGGLYRDFPRAHREFNPRSGQVRWYLTIDGSHPAYDYVPSEDTGEVRDRSVLVRYDGWVSKYYPPPSAL